MALPRLISVDDHVVEPPDLWERYLPEQHRAWGPRVERVRGKVRGNGRHFTFPEREDGYWADRWVYDGVTMPITSGFVAVCFDRDDVDNRAVLFDQLLPGCTDPAARLADMDANHVEASLCFPTFPRFCGQTFLEGDDKELGLACVQAYNDWMIDEWCGGEARARLIPLTLLPLWDPQLAAAEVHRCAAKGSHAVCFSEGPAALGLPSVHTDHWDPLWAACEATDTVVNMHIGSSSTFPQTSSDAPGLVTIALTFEGAAHALVDWLCSGVLERFGALRIVLSEGQVGWMPYVLERLDNAWVHARGYGGVRDRVPNPPSSYVDGRVYGCIFDDQAGLAMRDTIGMSQIMIETDYPHGDSTWPHSLETAERIVAAAGLDDVETHALLRGNAIDCYGLDRHFGIAGARGTSMHDLVVRGGQVIDGTGAGRRVADVAVDGGRIAVLAPDVGEGTRTIDADGRVVAPGFVDVHTHLDVQGFWDPALSPSPLHGVTTVLGGDCGFTVAPLADGAADYLMRMLARVEGMPLESLEQGVPWDWTSTAEYLDRLDGTLALNAGFMVGHSALRRVVMGEAATERNATLGEVDRMVALLRAGLAAGAIGFSSTWSTTHNDADGRPVPSRHASAGELLALAAVCGEFEGTSLEFLPGVGRWDAETEQVMLDMTVAAQRPLNWNIITGSARSRGHWQEKLALSDRARELGGKIVGLAIPRIFGARFCFRSGFVLDAIEGWRGPMALPPAAKLALLSDPAGRAHLAELAEATTGMGALTDWGGKLIVETFSEQTKRYEGRTIADISAEEGKEPFDALLDIVVADDLRTSFRNATDDDTDEDWVARAELWRDPRAVVGASDAGAHLDMLATFSFATDLLAFGVRQHGLLTTEEAVRLLTAVPADLYGLRDRGRLAEGAIADLVVFDEATVGPEEVSTRFDLPGGAGRLYAGAHGVDHVLVNGVPIVAAGQLTGATPGTLLRSGRDTATPSLA